MSPHKITIPRTAHYYTLGEPTKNTRRLWIVCHGYGQLARTFLRRFAGLDDGQTLVVAPEGLSKFYWEGYTGHPVASWMTREHRLDEIEDYCNFLQAVYEKYLPQLADDVQVTLLGFSQGTATITRWLMRDFVRYDHLVLWAGALPDDLDFAQHADFFNAKKMIFAYGKQDPFITEKRLDMMRGLLQKNQLRFEELVFDGEHTVEPDALAKVCRKFGL